jgi:hypothetical protein
MPRSGGELLPTPLSSFPATHLTLRCACGSPVYDPCGMAGGSTTHRFNAGEYNTTRYAKQGDLVVLAEHMRYD